MRSSKLSSKKIKRTFSEELKRKILKEFDSGKVRISELFRLDHPLIGVRKMYKMLKPDFIGIARFESYMLSYRFKINYKLKYIKTATSLRYSNHKNLLKGHVVKGINRVWVSDTTYFIVLKKVYYIVFIKYV